MFVSVCVSHIDQAGEVSFSQVVEDGGFVEEGEGGHVLHFAKFGRVHLLDVVFVHRHFMTIGELHQHLYVDVKSRMSGVT